MEGLATECMPAVNGSSCNWLVELKVIGGRQKCRPVQSVKTRWYRNTSFSFDLRSNKSRGLPFVCSRHAQVLHVVVTMNDDFSDSVFRERVRESQEVVSPEIGGIQDIHFWCFLCVVVSDLPSWRDHETTVAVARLERRAYRKTPDRCEV